MSYLSRAHDINSIDEIVKELLDLRRMRVQEGDEWEDINEDGRAEDLIGDISEKLYELATRNMGHQKE